MRVTHGALFTFGCSLYSSLNKASTGAYSIGRVYIYETVGTLLGGIVFTYLLIPHLNAVSIAFAIALLDVVMCLVLLGRFWFSTHKSTRILGYASVVILFLLCLLLSSNGAGTIQRTSITKQWKGQNVLHYENSVYGNVTVIKREEQYTFMSDGVPVLTTPTPDIAFVEEFVHLPMLHHPAPKEILVISGGAGGVINEILKHSVERIDYVELDPLILDVVKKYSTPLTDIELNSPSLAIHYLDGRYFTRKTVNRYDVIFIGLSNPQDLQVNRLFTKEFFTLARNRLKEKGILVTNMPGSLTYLGEELKNLNRCILKTLNDVFLYTKIIPGDGLNLYLASGTQAVFSVDNDIIIERLRDRNLETRLLTPFHIEYKLHPRWHDWFIRSIAHGTERINKDFHPLGVFYSLAYWNALFSPNLRGLFRFLEGLSLQVFAAILLILLLLFLVFRIKVRGMMRLSIPLCILTTGFAGMLFDLILIFAFQTLYGYVFYWIGILVSVFMVGAALGGYVSVSILRRTKRHFTLFIGTEISLIAFSGLLPLILLRGEVTLGSPILFLPLAFFSGLLIGLEFPLANALHLSTKGKLDLSHTAGLLYGMDLLGGWLGGIIGGIVLLPALGLLGTCVLICMFKVSTLIVISSASSSYKQPGSFA